jgi:hypothetical protein
LVVWFQTGSCDIKSLNNTEKFLFVQNSISADIVAKLSKTDSNSSLISKINLICQNITCDKRIDFVSINSNNDFTDLLEKLLLFIQDNNITKSSIVANNRNLDINFLLHSEEELKNLRKLYENNTFFIINDKSSVMQLFDIEKIEKSINEILKNKKIIIKSKIIDFETRKILNRVFSKIRALGSSKVEFYLQEIKEKNTKFFKDFILNQYPWIKDIKIIKSNKNNIKIKEVLP